MLEHPQARRELTQLDPLAFALTYLPHHLRGEATGGDITFSEFHLALCEHAKRWIKPLKNMKNYRDAYIAPREIGKSTWLFLILPMWAAAHEHISFIAAFSDSATQAEGHLQTFRHELDTNNLLKTDYPNLCKPKQMTRVARQLADNRRQIHQANSFVFQARGIDSSVLGMKVGSRRPEMLILDDVEEDESNYSAYKVRKRLTTIQDSILYLNPFARVVWAGTVTMHGSLIHQMVQSVTTDEPPAEWITEENFRIHYFPAITEDEEGTERSIWPEKWDLEWMNEHRHTRSFLKNMLNRPVPLDGRFWTQEDIKYKSDVDYGPTLLSIDPAVTSKSTSDYTGLAVVSRELEQRRAHVRWAGHVKLSPHELRLRVLEIIEQFEDISLVLIETNQGGDVWAEILHGLPVKLRTIHQTDSKLVRAQRVLNDYQRSKVFHAKPLGVAESEMQAFPNAVNDDIVDAIVTGVKYALHGKKPPSAKAKQMSYV